MGKQVFFDQRNQIIVTYSHASNLWKDLTMHIRCIYEATYYGNFSGYNIYFDDGKKRFYKADHVKILDRIKTLDLSERSVYINSKFTLASAVIQYSQGFYQVINKKSTFITKDIQFHSSNYKGIHGYFMAIAAYAQKICNTNEPLYYLTKNYNRIELSEESILVDYCRGVFTKAPDNKQIIAPFDFNQSQYQAIENAMNYSISVIEGPPGTGKTQTILNLIANIIYRKKNCAIISNNNTAIANIYQKLQEEGLAFIAAKLGNYSNIEEFFEFNHDRELTDYLKKSNHGVSSDIEKQFNELNIIMKRVQTFKINIATLNSELNAVITEQSNQKIAIEELCLINENLSSGDYQTLISRIEKPRRIHFIERLIIKLKFKIKIKSYDIIQLISTLEYHFYQKRIKELKQKISFYQNELERCHYTSIDNQIKVLSKQILMNQIVEYYANHSFVEFNPRNYKNNYHGFVKRYPIVISTSHSLLNNAPKGFSFDYVIIDEASQGDLLSSILAISCARKLVVVGDSKQLQHIEEERFIEEAKRLSIELGIPKSYRYECNSILKSVRNSIPNVPVTLLKEHYRCAPDIINFCNQMFYNNELIPMTINSGVHIEIIKTVPGNHARKNPTGSGFYNQREIDELKDILKNKNLSKTGVITPFRCQANKITDEFINTELEADTVHKFQGRQKDEIILSFVVNSLDKSPEQVENYLFDFITNEKLFNVAISRGKNKVTIIVSDSIYQSRNNIIHDFIQYAEYLYGSQVTKESTITSIFDYLYSINQSKRIELYKRNSNGYQTELLMRKVIEKVLQNHQTIGYITHMRLAKIINNTDGLNEQERQYVLHPWTHVDVTFYHKVTKELLFVLEVDGIHYHEQNEKQSIHDEVKNRVLKNNHISIYRFKTNESNEEQRLQNIFNNYVH